MEKNVKSTFVLLLLNLLYLTNAISHKKLLEAEHGVDKRSTQNEVLDRHDIEELDLKQDLKAQKASQLHRWSEAAFSFLQTINCSRTPITTSRECQKLLLQERSQMSVYLAKPSLEGFYNTVLDDGSPLRPSGRHDAVLVLDPYNGADFGHLLIIFYIDLFVNQNHCHQRNGVSLAENECLLLVVKRRCRNSLERRMRRKNFARRCEINFLPRVYIDDVTRSGSSGRSQELRCRSDELPQFGACPKQARSNGTRDLFCDPIRDNTKRCETQDFKIRTSCRMMEICDQAVMISGGWDETTLNDQHKDNIYNMYNLLRTNSFKTRNIKIFYANGLREGITVPGESVVHDVYPAAMKYAMRDHIRTLCNTPYCVDTLVLYLNGPSRMDGTILLWDADSDGIASTQETYSLEELMTDLSGCSARRVHVVADQSYGGVLAKAIKRSKAHESISVYTSANEEQSPSGSEYTNQWMTANHSTTCMNQIHKIIKNSMKSSTPDITEATNTAPTTIFGAPCNVVPPFTERELRHRYLGCQNLPTAVWMRRLTGSTGHSSIGSSSPDPVKPLIKR